MMWRSDPAVELTRKRPGWPEFHRACARHDIFFDHIEKDGKRSPYRTVAYTLSERFVYGKLADGSGKTPLDAIVSAYKAVGKPVADRELTAMLAGARQGTAHIDIDDIDQLLGGDAAGDDFEDLIG